MFRSVNGRCFVDFSQMNLPISSSEALAILREKGFHTISIDVAHEARNRVGKGIFRLGTLMRETPESFDCSSFTKWVYGKKGVWIPRLAVQQFEAVQKVELDQIQPGDLVFTSGYCRGAWYIGHVSLYSGPNVITAMIREPRSGVVEIPFTELLRLRELRGIGRMATTHQETATLVIPPCYEIETSDDVKYLVLSWIT